jgi:hypothetical protein
MNSKPTTIIAYAKSHPIKSAAISVFALFTILGSGFGILNIVAPDAAEALVQGPGCCGGGGGWDGWDDPYDPWDPGIGIGGGGGGGGGGVPSAPACTLVADPTSITEGGQSTLTWTTTNANEVTIDNGIGTVAVGSGNTLVSPTNTTLYRLSATNTITGRITVCNATVTVTPVVVPPAPVCTIDIDPSVITLGGSAQLTWTTTNGDTFHVGGGVGSLTPVAGGDTFVTPGALGTYTYVGVVTSSDGQTATCSDSVTVVPPIVVNSPACTLDINPSTITIGESAQIAWTTQHGDTFSIDNGVGSIPLLTTPNAGGAKNITPTIEGTITYTGTVTSVDGQTATCSDTVQVLPIGVDAPACTFEAEGTTLTPGQSTTLTWTTTNATEVHLQHLDAITPDMDLNGSITTQALGLYTLTAISATGDSVECTVTLTRVTIPSGPACTLEIDKVSMVVGNTAEMEWTTTNGTSFAINGETEDLNGSKTISPGTIEIHTYTGVVTDADGNTAECSDSINVTGGGGGPNGPACQMSFSESTIVVGQTSDLTWSTTRVNNVDFTPDIGSDALSGTETIALTQTGTHEYTLVATGSNGQIAMCQATLTITSGGGGCTSNCGGGGPRNPSVTIDFLKGPGLQPLAFVTLSQIPYTGLELGSIGTIIYWIILIIWSSAVAYLVLFKFLPYTGRKLKTVGSAVTNALDATEESTIDASMHEEMEDIQIDGFAPKSHDDEVLSVEDIVRGLSRMHQERAPAEEPVAPVFPVEEAEEEPAIYEEEVVKEMSRPPVEVPVYTVPSVDGDDMRLLNALMNGDRDTSFSMLRRTMRNGGRPELLLEKALVHLDTAYRARIDGIACSEDIRRICAQADTALLEEVVDALATAVDTTYSQSQTGAKLALTRAHAVIERG